MKEILRYTAVILAGIFLLQYGILTAGSAEPVTDTAPEEIKVFDTREYHVLQALGLIAEEAGISNPNAAVTRVQFASLTASLLHMAPGKVAETEAIFSDVPADAWYAAQVYHLRGQNIMTGLSASEFGANTNITYAQAVKTLVSALGYDLQAMHMGGFPNGYLAVAASLKLSNAAGQAINDSITAETAVKLLYRTLDIDIMKLSGIAEDEQYTIAEGCTVLTQYHDIYKVEGILSDNGITALGSSSGIGKNEVCIDGVSYQNTNASFRNLLGYYVEAYTGQPGDGNRTLLYAMPVDTKNSVLNLSKEQLVTNSSEYSTTCIVYDAGDGRIRKASVDRYADLIYNGKAFPEFDVDTIKISAGTITLISHDASSYSVIIVNEFQNCVVSGVDSSTEKIYGKYGGSYSLSEYERAEIENEQGASVSLSDIQPGSVLSIEESRDKKQIRICVIYQRQNGTVEEIIDNGAASEQTYVIGGQKFRLSSDFIDAVDRGVMGIAYPKLNVTYTFYLDKDGKIAAVEGSDDAQYAFLLNAAMDRTTPMSDSAMLRFFMPNGEIFNAFTAKRFKINGEDMTDGHVNTGQDLLNNPKLYEFSKDEFGAEVKQGVKRQIVKIKLNALGDVMEFDFAGAPNTYGYHTDAFTLDYTGVGAQYKGSNQRCFAGRYSLTETTTVFSVPPAEYFNEKDIEIISPSQLVDGQNYDVAIYDADPTLVGSIAVITSAGGTEGYEQFSFVVDKVTSVLDEDGQQVKKIYGVYNGGYGGFLEREAGALPEDLKQGDVGRVSFLGTKLSKFEMMFRLQEKPAPEIKNIDGSLVGGRFVGIWGYLYARSNTALSVFIPNQAVSPGNESSQITAHVFNGNNVKVAVYDVEAKTVRAGTMADITCNYPLISDSEYEVHDDSVMIFVNRRMDYIRDAVVVKYPAGYVPPTN